MCSTILWGVVDDQTADLEINQAVTMAIMDILDRT